MRSPGGAGGGPSPGSALGRSSRLRARTCSASVSAATRTCSKYTRSCRSRRRQPGAGEGVQGFPQPHTAEIEHMVVGQRACVWPRHGQSGQVFRAHPLVHRLVRREVSAPGDAGFQVDNPGIRRHAVEYVQRIPPGPGETGRPRDRPIGTFGQADAGSRVTGTAFPQFRVAGARQYLVHAAAQHHITAEEQGHQPIGHIIHCARTPPARWRQLRRIGPRNCSEGAPLRRSLKSRPTGWSSPAWADTVPNVVFATRADPA